MIAFRHPCHLLGNTKAYNIYRYAWLKEECRKTTWQRIWPNTDMSSNTQKAQTAKSMCLHLSRIKQHNDLRKFGKESCTRRASGSWGSRKPEWRTAWARTGTGRSHRSWSVTGCTCEGKPVLQAVLLKRGFGYCFPEYAGATGWQMATCHCLAVVRFSVLSR